MAGLDLQISNLVLVATLVAVVVGLVILFFWYFKRAENLTDEDRLNIERVKVAWIGAAALGILILVAHKKEKTAGSSGSLARTLSGKSSSLL